MMGSIGRVDRRVAMKKEWENMSEMLYKEILSHVFMRATSLPPKDTIEIRHYGQRQFTIHCKDSDDADQIHRWMAKEMHTLQLDIETDAWSARVFDGFEKVTPTHLVDSYSWRPYSWRPSKSAECERCGGRVTHVTIDGLDSRMVCEAYPRCVAK